MSTAINVRGNIDIHDLFLKRAVSPLIVMIIVISYSSRKKITDLTTTSVLIQIFLICFFFGGGVLSIVRVSYYGVAKTILIIYSVSPYCAAVIITIPVVIVVHSRQNAAMVYRFRLRHVCCGSSVH